MGVQRMKLHWRVPFETWMKDFVDRPACNDFRHLNADQVTDDPNRVTCLNCQKRVAATFEDPEVKIERLARSDANRVARGRAVAILTETYRDEFERLWREQVEAAMPEMRARWLERERSTRAYYEQRDAKRRSELEAELAALA